MSGFDRTAKQRGDGFELFWQFEDNADIQYENDARVGEESTQGLDATFRPLSVNGRLRKFVLTAEHAETEE